MKVYSLKAGTIKVTVSGLCFKIDCQEDKTRTLTINLTITPSEIILTNSMTDLSRVTFKNYNTKKKGNI